MASAQQGLVAPGLPAIRQPLHGMSVRWRHGEQVAAMTHRRFGPRAEEALCRTLKDVADGHLTLWVRGRFFDEHTGTRLDPPEVRVLPDRQPQPGVPDPRGAWWTPLLERGWLEMSAPGPSMRYVLTQTGRQVLSPVAEPSGNLPAATPPQAGPHTAGDGAR